MEKKSEKDIQEYNKNLINKYPFLLPYKYDGNIPDNYDFSFTKLDEMPAGWKKAFGELLCEDILEALKKVGADAIKDYHIIQIKEKYGVLCWYDDAVNDEINDIISAYSAVSGYICANCGKLDTGMTNDGYFYPICEKCYCENITDNKKLKDRKQKYKKIIIKNSHKIPETYSYITFKRLGTTDCSVNCSVDISKIVNKIRKFNKEA